MSTQTRKRVCTPGKCESKFNTRILNGAKKASSLSLHFSYPSPLDEVRDHDDRLDSLFPDHPPEGVKRGRERALRPDVGPRLLEAINVVGIDVFTALLPRKRPELNPGVVV